MISMTSDDQTEQLEVARKIMACSDNEHYHNPLGGCSDCKKQEEKACAILSRHSALMKKRGAVEEWRKYRDELPANPNSDYESPEFLTATKRIFELEREIKELEVKKP